MAQESGSDLERRLAHAERQLSEALERQAAADEVLRLILACGVSPAHVTSSTSPPSCKTSRPFAAKSLNNCPSASPSRLRDVPTADLRASLRSTGFQS